MGKWPFPPLSPEQMQQMHLVLDGASATGMGPRHLCPCLHSSLESAETGKSCGCRAAETQHKHSWNDLGTCLPDHQHIVQGQGDNKTTLPPAIPLMVVGADTLLLASWNAAWCLPHPRAVSAGGGGEQGRIMRGLLTASLPEPCSSSVLLSELGEGGR